MQRRNYGETKWAYSVFSGESIYPVYGSKLTELGAEAKKRVKSNCRQHSVKKTYNS